MLLVFPTEFLGFLVTFVATPTLFRKGSVLDVNEGFPAVLTGAGHGSVFTLCSAHGVPFMNWWSCRASNPDLAAYEAETLTN